MVGEFRAGIGLARAFSRTGTTLTAPCAPPTKAHEKLVREFVEAAHGEGLRVGFYYSLMASISYCGMGMPSISIAHS